MACCRDEPIPVPAGVGHDRHRGARTAAAARARALELGIAEGEDTTVRGHHEVAGPVRRRHHAHNRGIQPLRVRRPRRSKAQSGDGAVKARVAEGEDPTIGSHEPVAAVIGRGRDPDDRPLEGQRPRRPVELRGAEGENPPIGADQPVAVLAAEWGGGRRGTVEHSRPTSSCRWRR